MVKEVFKVIFIYRSVKSERKMSDSVERSKTRRRRTDEVKQTSQSSSPMSRSFDEAISSIFSFLTMREHLSWSLVSRRQLSISLWSRSTPRLCSSIGGYGISHQMMRKFINATKLEISGWTLLYCCRAISQMLSLQELVIESCVRWTSYNKESSITKLTKLERIEVRGSLFPFHLLPRSVKHLILASTFLPFDDCDYTGVFELTSLQTLSLPRSYVVTTKFLNELATRLLLLTRLEVGVINLTVNYDHPPVLFTSLTAVSLTIDTTIKDGDNQVKVLDYLSRLPQLTSLELDIKTSDPRNYLSGNEQLSLIIVMKILATSFKFLARLSLKTDCNYVCLLSHLTTTTTTDDNRHHQSPLIASLRSFELSVSTTDPINCSIFSVWSNLTSLKIVSDGEIAFPHLPKLEKLDLSVGVASKFSLLFGEERLSRCIELYSHSLIHLILPPRRFAGSEVESSGENEKREKSYYNLLVQPNSGIATLEKLMILEIPRCWKSIDPTDCPRLMRALNAKQKNKQQQPPQVYFT